MNLQRAFRICCPSCPGLTIASLATAALMSCSPYPYSDDSQRFSTNNASLNTSYSNTKTRIAAERRLDNRMEWVSTRPAKLFVGPGCVAASTPLDACDLSKVNPPVPALTALAPTSSAPTSSKPTEDICRIQQPDVHPDEVNKSKIDALKPVSREDIFASLRDYSAALVAITKAQDRADFDAAAGKVSGAVGGLVASASLASGGVGAPVFGAVATASADIVLWVVGQALDHQRVHGSFKLIRDRVLGALGPISDTVSEKDWISRYVATRHEWLATNTAVPLLQKTTYRMDEFRKLIDAGNWDLQLPIVVRGEHIDESVIGAGSSRISAHVTEQRTLSLMNPMLKGEDVKTLQLALINAGAQDLAADGVFGADTDACVRAFQQSRGVVVDGIVGPATLSALGID